MTEVDQKEPVATRTSAIELGDCRCLACTQSSLHVESDVAVRCRACGASYDIYEGVPCLVRYQPDEILSLIEILSNVGLERPAPSAANYGRWVDLLRRYHEAVDREAVLEEATGGIKRFLPHRHRQYEQMVTLLDGLSFDGKAVLDVGAGEGFDSYILTSFGAEVTAVEFNPLLAKLGRDAVPGTRWFCSSGHALAFEDESFDVVIAQAAIHHITDVPAAIAEMLRVVRPGGYLFTISDSFRADRQGEDVVTRRFDSDPAVLRGVNEGIPRFGDFFASLTPYQDALEVDILTTRVHGYPNRAEKRREDIKELRHWRWPDDAEALSDASGGMSVRIRKLSSIDMPARTLTEEVIRPREILDGLESKEAAMARLAAKVPADYVNAPFPGPIGNTKFQLLNGWQARREDEAFRRAFSRTRWFLSRESAEQSTLSLELSLPPGEENTPEAPSLHVIVDGRYVYSGEVKRGEWLSLSDSVADVEIGRPFSVEIWLDAKPDPFDNAVFFVRRLQLDAD